MKGKFLLRLFSLSPALAALASYYINLLAAFGLKSTVDYSYYLSLQSWTVYFASVSALCLVDMKLSPNGHHYSAFRLFGLATVASILGATGLALAFAATGSIAFLVVGITGFFYATMRNLMMVTLIKGIPSVPIGLRLTRAGLLLVLGGLLYSGLLGHLNPLHFLGVQAIAAAVAIAIYALRIPALAFHRLGAMVSQVWKLDSGRWVRRNLSYLVDMVHTPLFTRRWPWSRFCPDYKMVIYVSGLVLPMAAVINEVIGERFRLRLGLADLDGLRNRFAPYAWFGRAMLFFYLALYISVLLVVVAASSDLFPVDVALSACLLIQTFLVCSSSTFSAIISRAGQEKLDLTINLIVLLLQFGIMFSNAPSSIIVMCVSLAISTKYIAQLLIASVSILNNDLRD
jgi:hypothetical protein